MGTRADTIDHLLDALAPVALSARKMLGEYALYLDRRLVTRVCDDRLFAKPAFGARSAISECLPLFLRSAWP